MVCERFFLGGNPKQIQISDMFFVGDFKNLENFELRIALLNCTLTYFFVELYGRINIPGRINFYGPEIKAILMPNLESIPSQSISSILGYFDTLCKRPILPIRSEICQEDRIKFDRAVLSALNLQEFQTAIYDALLEHVQDRLAKEKSMKPNSAGASVRSQGSHGFWHTIKNAQGCLRRMRPSWGICPRL